MSEQILPFRTAAAALVKIGAGGVPWSVGHMRLYVPGPGKAFLWTGREFNSLADAQGEVAVGSGLSYDLMSAGGSGGGYNSPSIHVDAGTATMLSIMTDAACEGFVYFTPCDCGERRRLLACMERIAAKL